MYRESNICCRAVSGISPIRLDTIGLAGFSYDFESLDGRKGPITSALEAFGVSKRSPTATKFLLLLRRFPILFHLPLYGSALFNEVHKATADISRTLFEKAKGEKNEGKLDGKEDHSIIGLLSTPSLLPWGVAKFLHSQNGGRRD